MFVERLLMMDGVSGEKVIDIPLDEQFRKRYGNPYAVTHRADTHRALLDGCKARPGLVELGTHSKVLHFDIADDGVSVELHRGARIDAAALVGADGWRSTVREQLREAAQPVARPEEVQTMDAALPRTGRELEPDRSLCLATRRT